MTTDTADARVLYAELRAAAVQAGIVDSDAAALLPMDGVSLDEKGNLALPAGYFDAARASKPYLFGQAVNSSTSSAATPPAPAEPRQRKAADMSEAERRAWKQANGIAVPYRR